MAITPSSVTVGTNNGSTATVTVVTSESPTATQVGDLVVVFQSNDFYAIANMITPTATGSPTLTAITGATADGGASASHVKAFWYLANTGGAQTISATHTGTHDEDKTLVAWVLPAAQVNTSTPVGASGATGTVNAVSATAQVLSGATAVASGAILLGHLHSSNSASTASYTTGTMTEAGEWHVFTSGVYASEQLASSGATGSRTITAASSTPWVGSLVIIEPSGAAATSTWLPTPPARRRPTLRPLRSHVSTPVRDQVNPPIVLAAVEPARRFRGLVARRSRGAQPVPAQVVVAAPAYLPLPVRTRLKGLRLFRPRPTVPVPAQVVVTPPVFPPESLRIRLKGLRLFRGRAAAPVPPQVAVAPAAYVPPAVRARLRLPVPRRHDVAPPSVEQFDPPQLDPRPRPKLRPPRSRITTPPLQQQPAPPLFARIRQRLTRIFRGDTRMAAPPQVILIAPPRVAQATRARRNQFAARRHRGGVDGWMVPGVHLCTTPRPNTGTTGHTVTLTARPATGITEDPC